jgi:hypothetical protein
LIFFASAFGHEILACKTKYLGSQLSNENLKEITLSNCKIYDKTFRYWERPPKIYIGKVIPLHAMEELGVRGDIAPTHS